MLLRIVVCHPAAPILLLDNTLTKSEPLLLARPQDLQSTPHIMSVSKLQNAPTRIATAPDTSVTSGLPSELWAHSFSFLTERNDVASARLVCHAFKDLSSPFLITRVVFAKRLNTLSHLYDVLEHPYFSKHVTELLYDASYYDEDIEGDYKSYQKARAKSERRFKRAELYDRYEEYKALKLRMRKHELSTETFPREEDHRQEDAHPEDVSDHESRGDEFEETESESDDCYGDEDEDEQCRTSGFWEYSMQHRHQDRMIVQGLPSKVVAQVFAGLPNLRRVTYGDYRNLGKRGESYDSLCDRLFGDVLEPRHASRNDERGREWHELYVILRAIALHEGCNAFNLVIGNHPYKPSAKSTSCLDFQKCPALPPGPRCKDYKHDFCLHSDEALAGADKIKRLSLPVGVQWAFQVRSESFVDRLLHAVTPTLISLEYFAVGLDLDQFRPQHHLFGRDMQSLEYLELRAWPFKGEDMVPFLARMSSTLRGVRLLGNSIEGARELAAWAGEHLNLSGVQIENYDEKASKIEDPKAMEALWLKGRPNCLPKVSFDPQRPGPVRQDEECGCLRS